MCTVEKLLKIVVAGLIFALWVGSVNTAHGKIPVAHNEVLSLHKLEALLWERNPSVEVLRLRTRSAEADAEQQKHNYGPSFNSRYSYHPESDTFNDAYTSSIHRGDFYMSYPLLDGIWRRKYEYRASKSEADVLAIRVQKRWNDQLYRLRAHYITSLEAAELTAGFKKCAYELATWVKPLKTRIGAHEALPVELLELEKIIMEADVSRLEYEKRTQQARNAIAALVCLETNSFLLPESGKVSWGEPPPEEELKEWACRRSSDLAIFSSRLTRERAASDAFPYKYLRLNATAGYTVEEDSIEGFESGSQFGLHFQIPILYKELADQRRIRRFFNEEALRKEIYAEQVRMKNRIASVYEDLNWLTRKKNVIDKDSQRLGEILRITRLRRDAHTGERRGENSFKTQYHLWLAEAEKIRLRYERTRNLNRLLHLAEIPHFDLMRKIGKKHPKKHPKKKTLAIKITKNFKDWSDAEIEFLLFFLKTKGVDQAFWALERGFEIKGRAVIAKRIALLYQNDIRLIASLGISKTPEAQSELLSIIERLAEYNRSVGENERFRGVHLEFSAEAGYEKYMLSTLENIRDRIGTLPLSVNIPIVFPKEKPVDKKESAVLKHIEDKIKPLLGLADEIVIQVQNNVQETVPEGLRTIMKKYKKIRLLLQAKSFLAKGGETGMIGLMEKVPCAGFLVSDYQGWRVLITTPPEHAKSARPKTR